MFFYTIVGIIAFLYLSSRISGLERKIKGLEDRGFAAEEQKVPDAQIQTPIADHTVEQAFEQHGYASSAVASTPVSAAPAPLYAPSRERTEEEKSNTEFAVGSKVLTAVGIVALFLGVGFFLRYAFANGLITESMRVFLGALFGVVLVVTGHILRKKYVAYGMGLVGTGLGMFYLVSYAAYAFYGLILEPVAFFLFLCITAVGIILSIFYDSSPLIRFSLLGGFIVPLLFPLAQSAHSLFPYLITLNLAVLIIARFKVWPELTGMGLIASSLLSLKWTASPEAELALVPTFTYLSIIFCMYFATSFINFIMRDRDYKGMDAFLVYALPTLYFLVSIPLIHTKGGFAVLCFSLAMFYLLASVTLRVIFNAVDTIKICSNIMLMVGSAFLAAAIALHFKGETLTILWAVEATLMVLAGYMLNTRGNRILGLVLALLAGLKAIVSDIGIEGDAVAIFNGRTFTLLMVTLMFGVIWYLYKMYSAGSENMSEDERNAGNYLSAVGLCIFPLIWATTEMLHFVQDDPYRYLPLLWSLYAVLLAGISFVTREFTFRIFAYITSAGAIMVLLVAGRSLMGDPSQTLFNLRFLTALVVAFSLGIFSAMIHKNRDQLYTDEQTLLKVFYLGINGVLLWSLSFEVLDYYNNQVRELLSSGGDNGSLVTSIENTKRVVLSILWLFYAVVTLTLGIVRKSRFARQASVGLLAITVIKIFLYDTSNLSDIYRFVSFISLGVILLLAGFAYYRFKDRIMEFVGAEDGLGQK